MAQARYDSALSRGWSEVREGDTFRLSRCLPVRWDVVAATVMPDLGRRRLAHAVRQDMWRMLRNVRGFSPVVEVTRIAGGCSLRAGGAVAGRSPDLSGRVQAMLEDAAHRAAWVRAAAHRSAQ